MTESTAPSHNFSPQDRQRSPEREVLSAPHADADETWQNIARAAWTQTEMLAATMPEISKQNMNEMLGLNFNPGARAAVPYTGLTNFESPGSRKGLIDWEALSRGESVVINPLPTRQTTGLDPRNQGLLNIPRIGGPEIGRPGDQALGPQFGSPGGKLLEPVRDPSVLSRVPDALYIGQKGTVTSMRNRGGEQQEYWLAGDAARAFAKAQEILATKGKQIVVSDKNGAGRTVDTQTEIYNRSNGGRGFAAGKPTSSNHTVGRAMDVSNYTDPDVKRALLAVGWRQGDSRGPIANDLHHFSFAGSPQSEGPQRRPGRRR